MRGRPKGRGEEKDQGAPSPNAVGAPREGRSPMRSTHTSTHASFKTHTLMCHVDYPLTCHVGKVGHLCMHPCHAYVAATYLDKSKCAIHKIVWNISILSL